MALQRVKTVFDGRWIESCRYIDYRLLDVYVPVPSSFQEFVNCIHRRLFPNSEVSVSRLTVYSKDCNNLKLIRIVDDKDVSWIMLVISKFSNNDLLIVVDTAPATDIGNTPGTMEDSYAMLSAFLDALIRNNPGTYTAEEANDEGRFKFYLMALAASIDAWNYCVPVISVDGAVMKNKYIGTLISACTIDGNSQIVPLAFVVVDSENDLSCSWFFQNLKAVFREHNEMIYPVDQHEFEVQHRKEQFVVNILNRTCSCRQWDLDLIPCSHACIALSTRNLNLHLYTDKFYYVSNWINLYKKGTRPIGSVNQIRNTHQGGNDGILPPQVKRPAGRLKKKRFTSFLEKKATVRCSRCGKKGHNCRSCKEPI
ncbi:uncharacterized protein E5676_scaffold572G00320 [Cucumis melo var. makuwa]|uniref:SWIM-type domain-containing protein n=1 Tax=Cucumis melo var. makuwa TaxID=1194695 RepID=A0A5A7VEN5_CUCMM|nr:uncharacterized protein E6C27_scaffold25G00500 [Cucumis melo var. makuwa]TYK06137.1 uncharacterized protein E5676_scaffold572G00320 [Cucumis melo var. makuwa]